MTNTQPGTLTQAIKHDHREMYDYHERYKKLGVAGDFDGQTRWANQLRWEIARHAVGEEIVVYPLMEKHLGAEGRKLADHDREDHQEVKVMLWKMEDLSPGTEHYDELMEQMMISLHRHNDKEETNDLPILEQHIGTEASKDAASQFSLTKKFVPTHPHPQAPNKPPFETLAGFLVAPIDKLKDAFSKFPTEEMKKTKM
ncbi:hypothetical protein K438DRAFT_1604028 [Mycena galopus ATCC 62051]|nr:hypothetical protein K438DRAFT_1604028 [Mycena galopus ATCC 62051]